MAGYVARMNTSELLQAFLKDCEARGRSPRTRQSYWYRLHHFAEAFPELPTSTKVIETFLAARGETPKKRGDVHKCLQVFYSYIERTHGIKSPVPSKGPVGRPRVNRYRGKISSQTASLSTPSTSEQLVQGGSSPSELRSTSSTTPQIKTRDAVDAYLITRKNKGCKPRTLKTKTNYLSRFAEAFETVPLEPEPISSWLSGLKSIGIRPRGEGARGQPLDQETKWSYQKELLAFYHFLERRHGVKYPVWPEERIHLPKKVRPVLDEPELRKLPNFCEDLEERAIILLIMDSDIRAGELCSLDRENVHPSFLQVLGKEEWREVPISPEIYELLCRVRKKGPVFRSDNKRLTVNALYWRVHRIMERAGLKGRKLGPHILRHSMSNQYMMKGGDLLSLKEKLGHTTTRMTERYGKMSAAQVQQRHREVDVLGKVLGTSAGAASPAPERPLAPAPTSIAPRPPRPPPAEAADERKRGLSGWGNLLIIGPKKKPVENPDLVGSTGQLALGL